MELKKDIELLLGSLKTLGFDRRAIEKELDYAEFYIDQVISKGGTQKFYNALSRMYVAKSNKGSESKVNDSGIDYLKNRRELKNTKEYVVPFYDAGATAGNQMTNTDTAITDPVGSISVGHFLSDAEAAIRIYGNSMMSNYPPGCILGISELKERIIQPGEVYVIETEEQRIFKRLFFKEDNPDSDVVMCYSDNTMLFEGGARAGKVAYPPFYVPLKNIRKINLVLGVVKRNANLLIR